MWPTYLIIFGALLSVSSLVVLGQKELGDVALGCPQGSYRLGDFCYVIFQTFVSFEEAETICETGSGILAPIKDDHTQQFLLKLRIRKFLHRYWLGLSDRRTEGEWVFADGTRLSGFTRWHRGEPNNYNKNQHCVNMVPNHYMEWDDEDCARKVLFICQYDLVNCTEGMPRFGQSCFRLSRELATYDEAELNCAEDGGRLASIKTEGMFNFIKSAVYADKFWMNMTDKHMQTILRDRGTKLSWVTDTWIGLRHVDGVWLHSDGSELSNFSYWAAGEPHAGSGGEDCVKLGQQWSDVQCDLRHSFICRYDVNVEVKASDVSNVPCVLRDTQPRMSSSAIKSSPANSKGVTIDVAQFSMVLLGCAVLGMLVAAILFMGIYWHRRLSAKSQSTTSEQDMEILRETDEDQA